MMLFWALGPAIVLGLATGGRFGNLAHHGLHFDWLLVPLLVAVGVLPWMRLPASDRTLIVLGWMLPILVCIGVALLNVRQPGFVLVLVGLTLNLLVVASNMAMPVLAANIVWSPDGGNVGNLLADSWLHVGATSRTSLLVLADVVPLPGPRAMRGMVSLGDLLLIVGLAKFVFEAMHDSRVPRG